MESEVYRYAIELGKPPFGKAPKRLDAVNVAMAVTGKFVFAMIHPEMARITDIHQAVVTPPAISVNDAFN